MSRRLRLIFSHPPPINPTSSKFMFQLDTRICSTVRDVQDSIEQNFQLLESEAKLLEIGGYMLLESDGAEIFEHDDVVSVHLKPGTKKQQLQTVTLSESEDTGPCLKSARTDIASDLVQEERTIGKKIKSDDKTARPICLKRKHNSETTNPKEFSPEFGGEKKSKVVTDMTKYTPCEVCDDDAPCSCTISGSPTDLVEEMLVWNEYQLYTPEDWKKMTLMLKSGIQKLTEKHCHSVSPPPIPGAQKHCLDHGENKRETTGPESCLSRFSEQETGSVVDLPECGTCKDKCDISQERSHTVKSGSDHAKTLSRIFLKGRDSISDVSEIQDSRSFPGEDDTKSDDSKSSTDFVKQMLECDGYQSHTAKQLEQMRMELENGIVFLTKKHKESRSTGNSPSTKSSSSSTIILPPVDMAEF